MDSQETAGPPRIHPAPRIDFRGPPVAVLPAWGDVAEGTGMRLVLHPPIEFEIAYQVPDFVVVMPYNPVSADVGVDDGPIASRALAAGSAAFVAPGTLMRARMRHPVEFLVAIVTAERAERTAFRAAGHSAAVPPVVELSDPAVSAVSLELRRSMMADPLREPAYLEALVDALFARYGCRIADRPLEPQRGERLSPGLLRRITARIEAGISGPLSIDVLAAEAGLSRWHFARAFRASTGQPPHAFVTARRVSRARDLLTATDRTVAEIAAATGFSSQSHLSRAFRKAIGLSPALYRRRVRGCGGDETGGADG